MLNNQLGTNQQPSTTKSERLCIVTPQITVWTGETVLRDSDIKIGVGGKLPEKELASLGRKALINKEELLPFRKLRERFRKECSSVGVPFLGGYAIASEEFPKIKTVLDGLIQEFDLKVEDLCFRYNKIVADWEAAHPEYRESLEADRKSVDEVRARFKSGYLVNKIVPMSGQEQELEKAVEGLYPVLLKDIRLEAGEYLRRSLQGQSEVTQKARNVVSRCLKKLKSLSFLNPEIEVLVKLVAAADAQLPSKGYLRESDFWRVFAIMSILSDEGLTAQVIAGQTTVELIARRFDPRIKAAKPVTPAAPVASEKKSLDVQKMPGDLLAELQPELDALKEKVSAATKAEFDRIAAAGEQRIEQLVKKEKTAEVAVEPEVSVSSSLEEENEEITTWF